MAQKLCKEQQISSGNSTKYSDFIDGEDPSVKRKSRLVKTIADIFLLKFPVSALIEIINMPEEFQKNCWSRSP